LTINPRKAQLLGMFYALPFIILFVVIYLPPLVSGKWLTGLKKDHEATMEINPLKDIPVDQIKDNFKELVRKYDSIHIEIKIYTDLFLLFIERI